MYFKITNEQENHRGLQFNDGEIRDILPFDSNPRNSCCPGGIYFTDEKNATNYFSYGPWIRQLDLPTDALCVKDASGGKWRASKVFLHPRKRIWTVETMQWLIDNGVKIIEDNSVFYSACIEAHIEVINFLIEKGVDISCNYNESLRRVCELGHLEVVKILVENGADVNDYYGSPLGNAALVGNLEMVKYLMEKGATLEMGDFYAARTACQNSHLDILKYFIEKGLDMKATSLLSTACSYGNDEIFNFLIENGANVNEDNGYSMRAVTRNGDIERAKILVEKGADIHSDGDGLLFTAVSHNELGMLKFLIESGVDYTKTYDALLNRASRSTFYLKHIVEYLTSLKTT